MWQRRRLYNNESLGVYTVLVAFTLRPGYTAESLGNPNLWGELSSWPANTEKIVNLPRRKYLNFHGWSTESQTVSERST